MLIDCLLVLNSEEEKKQFTEIYEREYIILIKFAINKLGNSNDAEDAVSEGFLRFAKNFQKYSQKSCSEIHALLVTIVRNIIIDHYRVSDRMVYRGDGPEKDEAFLDEVAFRYDEADNPEKQYITKEATKRMITAIDALTADDIGAAVAYVCNLPDNVQIPEMILTPANQADSINKYYQK